MAALLVGRSLRTWKTSWSSTIRGVSEVTVWRIFLFSMCTRRFAVPTPDPAWGRHTSLPWSSPRGSPPAWWAKPSVLMGPLKAVFVVLFSRICSLTDKWDEAILDPELNEEFKTFLKVLQEKLPLMTSMPRCVIPPGFFPAGINGHSDGSLFLSSWVFFILSCAEADPTKFSSWITGAGAKVKHHSVAGKCHRICL